MVLAWDFVWIQSCNTELQCVGVAVCVETVAVNVETVAMWDFLLLGTNPFREGGERRREDRI